MKWNFLSNLIETNLLKCNKIIFCSSSLTKKRDHKSQGVTAITSKLRGVLLADFSTKVTTSLTLENTMLSICWHGFGRKILQLFLDNWLMTNQTLEISCQHILMVLVHFLIWKLISIKVVEMLCQFRHVNKALLFNS